MIIFLFVPGAEERMSDDLPPNEYYELFKPEYSLHITPDPELVNKNNRKQLEQVGRTSRCQVLAS